MSENFRTSKKDKNTSHFVKFPVAFEAPKLNSYTWSMVPWFILFFIFRSTFLSNLKDIFLIGKSHNCEPFISTRTKWRINFHFWGCGGSSLLKFVWSFLWKKLLYFLPNKTCVLNSTFQLNQERQPELKFKECQCKVKEIFIVIF